MDNLDEGRRVLRARAVGAKVGIALVVLTGVVTAAVMLLWPLSLSNSDDLSTIGGLAWAPDLAMLVSAIPVGMWIHRAHANLEAANLPGLEYTPGWSIGWFFIPFASLWKPFSAMRELWNASNGAVGDYSETAPALLWVWWLAWIFRGLAGFETVDVTLGLIGIAALLASAVSLWIIVDAVTRRQESIGIGEVFA